MIFALHIQLQMALIFYYMIEEWIYINQQLIFHYAKKDAFFYLMI